MSKEGELTTDSSRNFFNSFNCKVLNSFEKKKKVKFKESIGIIFVESFKKYNKIQHFYGKKEKYRLLKSQKIKCNCEIF